MNRRELLTRLGATGACLTVGSAAVAAEGHGHSSAYGTSGPQPRTAGPLATQHAHFCGIHVAKHDPAFQLIVQHYCAAHLGESEEDQMFQCILFDSSQSNAKVLGIEYIVSDARYHRLPEAEKKFWHPHTYEVLAGGLIAPGMNAEEEQKFMKGILTTWGKTWHTWPDPKSDVPLGEPMLMWALSGDNQIDPAVLKARDAEFGVDAAKLRAERTALLELEVPQVPFPTARDQVGRQWTADGEDRPTPRER